VSNTADVEKGVSLLIEEFKTPVEININMGCPQSSMQKEKLVAVSFQILIFFLR